MKAECSDIASQVRLQLTERLYPLLCDGRRMTEPYFLDARTGRLAIQRMSQYPI
jgi:hypothetical protein